MSTPMWQPQERALQPAMERRDGKCGVVVADGRYAAPREPGDVGNNSRHSLQTVGKSLHDLVTQHTHL